jgi:hypothetical protein
MGPKRTKPSNMVKNKIALPKINKLDDRT